MLYLVDQFWVSDNTEAVARLGIQEGFAQVMPAITMESQVTHMGHAPAPLAFRFHVSMLGVLGISADLLEWTAEERALGAAMGAHPATFAGLAGTGDLIVTCLSPHSRNSTFGRKLGRGMTVEQVVADTHQTAEGVASCGAILALAQAHGVSMPIVENVTAVVHEGRTAQEFAEVLMRRMHEVT